MATAIAHRTSGSGVYIYISGEGYIYLEWGIYIWSGIYISGVGYIISGVGYIYLERGILYLEWGIYIWSGVYISGVGYIIISGVGFIYRIRAIFGGSLVWRLLSYIQLADIIIGGP